MTAYLHKESVGLAAGLLLCLTAGPRPIAVSPSGKEPAITVQVVAESHGGPVDILGFRRPEKPSRRPKVHLRNNSSQTTRRIWIEVVASGRNGKVAHAESSERTSSGRVILRHNDGFFEEPILQSSGLVLFSSEVSSNCLRVTVSVAKVEFADGSTWSIDEEHRADSQAYAGEAGGSDVCLASTATKAELDQLSRSEYDDTAVVEAIDKSEEVRTYSFVCGLVPKRGELVAICPS